MIEFISLIDGVEETMPIIPASQQKYDWVQKATKDFKDRGSLIKLSEDVELNSCLDVTHTSKCPGIIRFKGKGFIVKNHSDIKLKIKDNLYEWTTPTSWADTSNNFCEDAVSHHLKESLHDFMSGWPKDTLPIIIKINLPWHMRIPKNWEVMMIDPFYKDDFRFTVCPGIFEHDLGLAKLTVPVFWHSTNGEFLIKSGTPIAQLIPIKQEKINYTLKNKTTDKNFKKDFNLMFLKMKENFDTNYNKIRNFFKS